MNLLISSISTFLILDWIVFNNEVKASEIGLDTDTKDISVFYKRVFHAQKSMFNMTDKELSDFLSDVYKDVNSIQDFVSVYLFNKNEE